MKHVLQQLRRDKPLQRHKLILDVFTQAPLHIKPGLTQVGEDCQCTLTMKCLVLIMSCHISICSNTTPPFTPCAIPNVAFTLANCTAEDKKSFIHMYILLSLH